MLSHKDARCHVVDLENNRLILHNVTKTGSSNDAASPVLLTPWSTVTAVISSLFF